MEVPAMVVGGGGHVWLSLLLCVRFTHDKVQNPFTGHEKYSITHRMEWRAFHYETC